MKELPPPSDPAPRIWPAAIAVHSGVFALLVGAVHFAVFLFTPDLTWAGPVGLRKPAMFGVSIGLTLLSLGWLLRYFAPRPRLHAVLLGGMSITLLIELAIIVLQRIRRVPSHFNFATAFDGALWSAMGLAIMIFALLATAVAVLSFGRLEASPPMRTAIRAGMLLLVLSQVSGQLIVINGMRVVLPNGEFVTANIVRAGTFGAAGDLKLPHALALHGLQALPPLGALVARLNWSAGPASLLVGLAGMGFFGVTLTAQLQAYTGRSVTDLSPLAAVGFFAGLVAFTVPWAVAINAWCMGTAERKTCPASC